MTGPVWNGRCIADLPGRSTGGPVHGSTWASPPEPDDPRLHRVAMFIDDHTRGDIYSPVTPELPPGRSALADPRSPPTRSCWPASWPTGRPAILHAAGMDLGGQGLPLRRALRGGQVHHGHACCRDEGKILCDDRIIVRRWPDGFRIHGTWSHGDVPDVSPGLGPPAGDPVPGEGGRRTGHDPHDRPRRGGAAAALFLVIKPLVTADWWEKTLDVVEHLVAREVPAYRLQFDLSGRVRDVLRELCVGLEFLSCEPLTDPLSAVASDGYAVRRSDQALDPRQAPLAGPALDIELTERCNNACIHCYINLPAGRRPGASPRAHNRGVAGGCYARPRTWARCPCASPVGSRCCGTISPSSTSSPDGWD